MTPKSLICNGRRFRVVGSVLLLLMLVCGPGSAFSALAAGQEVTGNIQGEVKDQSGAVVPNAAVTATSQQRSFKATTNSDGLYRFNNLAPGVYTVTATVSGFSSAKVENVTVELGRTLNVVLEVTAAGTTETVTVTGASEPIVDVTSTKVATNVTKAEIDVLPKTLNFDSIINVAPGARNEPNGGGFQIDGASGSENRFVVDGLDVTRVFGGTLGSTKNIPYDFVNEVQIKSAGYEAEFGGATGGVINVVTRSGSNDWHGEVRVDYSNDHFRAADNPVLRRQLTDLTKAQYFLNPQGKDRTRLFAPTVSLSGPIYKNKLWFFLGYAPEYNRTQQQLNLISVTAGAPAETVLNSRLMNRTIKNDYFISRVDYSPWSKLQINGSFINSPVKTEGTLPGTDRQTPSTATFNDPRHQFKGGYTPSWQGAMTAIWTPFSNLVVSARIGRNYLNDKGTNYDIPVNTVQPVIINACTAGLGNCVSGSTAAGNPIIASNNLTLFDITKRTNYNFDASYIQRVFGQQHIFKGGYQRSNLFNNILNERSGGYVNFYYGQSYQLDENTSVRGQFGYYDTNIFGLEGTATSNNQSIFFQDQWQIHRRVTLNLGVRFENEFLPAYPINLANHPSLSESDLEARGDKLVSFGWGDKVAPRLGAAWDVFGDGRLKLYGSYSVFYDIMKYDLARGSGGGEFWIRNVFKLDQLEFRGISPSNHPGDFIDGPIDLRLPSIGVSDPPGIDPDLKPMREHEYTFGADYALSRDLLVSGRFTRKNLDRAIDDIGHSVPGIGEEFTVGNPGFGIGDTFYHSPKAIRRYTGFELRVDKRFSNNWYANASYTYSRLFGNYGGLASSDEFGRANPNINRYFDNLALSFDNFGNVANGLLPTDRPNTFKFFGDYSFNWLHRLRTDVGVSQYVYQGTPISTSVAIIIPGGSAFSVLPNGRGDLGRTPWLTETGLLVTQKYRVNERIGIKFQLNVTNLWDERNELGNFTGGQGSPNMLAPGQSVSYATPEDYINGNGDIFTRIKTQHRIIDPRFNLPFQFQNPREARIAVGIEW
jgi:Carboxypeptidase regulatory-like domain/TonB dependent receptor/TonB-dependent Receptor Plug Domain